MDFSTSDKIIRSPQQITKKYNLHKKMIIRQQMT